MPDSATAMADVMPTVTPFDAALGAEVSNINLSKPLSDAQFAVVEDAFLKASRAGLPQPTADG